MTLCQACQSIDIRDLLESLDAFSASDREVSYCSRLDYLGATENYQPHHGNFAALRAAAKSGCDFCSMIVFHHHETALQEWTHEDPECDCTRFLGPVRLAAYQDKTTDFVLLVVFITSKHKRETHPAYIVAEFEICVAKGESALLVHLGESSTHDIKARASRMKTPTLRAACRGTNCLKIWAPRNA